MAVVDGQPVIPPAAGTHARSPRTVISNASGWSGLRLRELWDYRELLYFLVWRDLKVRYRQTALGAAWAIIQPVFSMVIFSIFFGQLAKIPSDGFPYPVFTYTALLPWQLFAQSLALASNSMINSGNLISKVYFPRLVIPLSSVLASVADFAIAFLVLIGLMIYYHIVPTLSILVLPLLLLLALVTALGVGLWLAALNVRYRDIRHALPFLIQVWMFATPVVYPSSLLSEPWRTLYGLNPMVGVIEGFRWALLGTNPPGPMMIMSVIISVALFISGLFYFRSVEKTFADIV
jgi:lipopolysaccharide transport system permease protein